MKAKDVFDSMISVAGATRRKAGAVIGLNHNQITQKVCKDTLKFSDFVEIADRLGVDMIFVAREGREHKVVNRYGPRLRGKYKNIQYDTDKATMLSNSFWADGENKYGKDGLASVLYVDDDSHYFLAEYSSAPDRAGKIQPVSGDIAAAYIGFYGENEDRSPKE